MVCDDDYGCTCDDDYGCAGDDDDVSAVTTTCVVVTTTTTAVGGGVCAGGVGQCGRGINVASSVSGRGGYDLLVYGGDLYRVADRAKESGFLGGVGGVGGEGMAWASVGKLPM